MSLSNGSEGTDHPILSFDRFLFQTFSVDHLADINIFQSIASIPSIQIVYYMI